MTTKELRELDMLVHKRVFGFESVFDPLKGEAFETFSPRPGVHEYGAAVPPYSREIAWAWAVAERVWLEGNYNYELERGDFSFRCRFTARGEEPAEACGPTAPVAICRAALKAVE